MHRTPDQQSAIDGFRKRMEEIESSKQDKETKLSDLFNLYTETMNAAGELAAKRDDADNMENELAFGDAAGETAQVGMQIATTIIRIDPEEWRKRLRTTTYKDLFFK